MFEDFEVVGVECDEDLESAWEAWASFWALIAIVDSVFNFSIRFKKFHNTKSKKIKKIKKNLLQHQKRK